MSAASIMQVRGYKTSVGTPLWPRRSKESTTRTYHQVAKPALDDEDFRTLLIEDAAVCPDQYESSA